MLRASLRTGALLVLLFVAGRQSSVRAVANAQQPMPVPGLIQSLVADAVSTLQDALSDEDSRVRQATATQPWLPLVPGLPGKTP